jgi:hypothetical protein
MELLKNFRVVIFIVLTILILVVIRTLGVNHFKSDAKKWVEPSLKHVNTLNIESAKALPGNNLIVRLDKDEVLNTDLEGKQLIVSADSILDKKIIRRILKFDGNILLEADDPGLSARIWMILRQMGCRNIYILTKDTDNEVLKYKFRPDSMPETDLQ